MPVDFHSRKEQASGGVGGGRKREFAKNLQRERSSFLFCFVGVAFFPSLRRALFSPSLFSFTLVENRPEQEHRKNTE